MLQIAEDILSHISRPNYQFHDTRDVWNNNNNNNNGSAFQFQNSMERTFKRDLRSHKVSLLITSAFSLAAALIVIILVLSDARAVQQRSFSLAKRSRPSLWSCIHKAEVMPFAIAIASMAQASVFLGVQSQSLVSMWSSGCTRTAQLVWPAIWIVAFTVTAFSLESTFRSLQAVRFGARGKLHVFMCVALIASLIVAAFVTAHVLPSEDVCWGSLVWWVSRFVQPSIALGAGIILVNIVTGLVLVIQLKKCHEVCRDERIATSRVIYSLGINILLLTLTLPFFISFALGNLNKDASLMADTVVTLNGLLHGVLHLFSRTNSEQIAIRPKDIPWASSRPFRLFGPNDLNIHDFISTPIITDRDVERTMLYTGMEKKVFSGYQNEPALPRQQFISIHPDVPPVSFLPSSMVVKKTASQYSLYPLDKVQSSKIESTHASKPSTSSDSSKSANSDLTLRPPGGSIHTTFSNDSELFNTDLQPPEPLFSVHKTRNSETTSAIVEIALRLSNAPSYADSVYTHKPISPIESLNLKKAPSLISPDKYVSSARLAEAAKSRPINTGETDQTADMSQVHKLMPPTKLIGLPKVPKTNLRESIANLILKRQSSISRSTNKELPPVPGLENPQENAASKALLKSSYSKALAPTQQAILPAPDWR